MQTASSRADKISNTYIFMVQVSYKSNVTLLVPQENVLCGQPLHNTLYYGMEFMTKFKQAIFVIALFIVLSCISQPARFWS